MYRGKCWIIQARHRICNKAITEKENKMGKAAVVIDVQLGVEIRVCLYKAVTEKPMKTWKRPALVP